MAVNKALSGDDAPGRLKRPEQSVNETCLSYRTIDMIYDTTLYDIIRYMT